MAVLSGYYDSISGDRKYSAETMSRYFAGLFGRGVVQNYEGKFVVKAGTGMQVVVQTGKAYFTDGKWIENTAEITKTIDPAEVLLSRIDSIILRNNKNSGVRSATVELVKGTPATDPKPPELAETNDYIEELRLCNIRVEKQTDNITQANITNTIPDTEQCGYVTGLIEQVDTHDLYMQYEQAYKEFQEESRLEFEDWFNNVKETLSTSTLIRTYKRTYVTETPDEKRINIEIPQHNSMLDIIEVYVNGFRLSEEYYKVIDLNEIELTYPVDQGTEIEFVIYKSVDGSNAETIIEQVETLQAAMDQVNKYTYYATGEDDNKKLSQLAQDFYGATGKFSGAKENEKIEIKVVGDLKADMYISGTGENEDPYVYFQLGKMAESTRGIKFDFTATGRINIEGQQGKENVAFYGDDYEIKGIKVAISSGNTLTAFAGKKIRCSDSEVYVNGTGTETVKGVTGYGTYNNTKMSVTTMNNSAYGFMVEDEGITKLIDCEILAYNATGAAQESAGAIVLENQTEAVLIMTNCNLPIKERSGYKQSQTIKVNSGYCALTGNVVGKEPELYSDDEKKCVNIGTLLISK